MVTIYVPSVITSAFPQQIAQLGPGFVVVKNGFDADEVAKCREAVSERIALHAGANIREPRGVSVCLNSTARFISGMPAG